MDNFSKNYNIQQYVFDGKIKDCYRVIVSGDDWSLCHEASKHRWSNEKTGHYGSGMANTANDEFRVTRIGLIGEVAFGKIFDLEVDFGYRKGGDKSDFVMGPEKLVDVKTATCLQRYARGLIYAKSEGGVVIPLKADIFVFSFLEKESKEEKAAIVNFVGYEVKSVIEKIIPVLGRKIGSKHMNYEIKYSEMKPMSLLIKAHERFLYRLNN